MSPPVPSALEHAGGGSRVHERSRVELQITLESDTQFYAGFSENLSEGGVFVATHELQPVGTHVEILLSLPNAPALLRVTGEVRWQRPYNENSDVPPGIGIRFKTLRSEDAALIRAFLEMRAPMFFDDE